MSAVLFGHGRSATCRKKKTPTTSYKLFLFDMTDGWIILFA
jgi:hypothetical protein